MVSYMTTMVPFGYLYGCLCAGIAIVVHSVPPTGFLYRGHISALKIQAY